MGSGLELPPLINLLPSVQRAYLLVLSGFPNVVHTLEVFFKSTVYELIAHDRKTSKTSVGISNN